jgi:hypothetical protein
VRALLRSWRSVTMWSRLLWIVAAAFAKPATTRWSPPA